VVAKALAGLSFFNTGVAKVLAGLSFLNPGPAPFWRGWHFSTPLHLTPRSWPEVVVLGLFAVLLVVLLQSHVH
jgi:hypothetical protein